jgi:hypothetical protein
VNELILKEYNNIHIVYLYLPEGKGNPGEIAYDIIAQEATVVVRASEDQNGRYGHNATRKIKEYVKRKILPMTAIQAWC